MTIYAATSNPGKLREFAESASSEAIDVLALPGLRDMPEPVEDAATFMDNAELKAVAYSKLALASGQRGLMVFADDSGLEVDALGGRPGVRSARFADDLNFEIGTGSKDERNNRCLLSLIAELEREEMQVTPLRYGMTTKPVTRTARFVCALALARDGEVLLRAEGSVEGEVLDAPRGENGFGYDPLFLVPSLGLTMAELPREQKWRLSHRGNAFRNLLAQLRS